MPEYTVTKPDPRPTQHRITFTMAEVLKALTDYYIKQTGGPIVPGKWFAHPIKPDHHDTYPTIEPHVLLAMDE